jgi:hypothetical protein
MRSIFLLAMAALLPAQQTPSTSTRTYLPVSIDKNPTAPSPYLRQVQQRRFEERFNKLAQAISQFSNAYNENKGQAWPADKAEALRKAMADLQKIDPNFHPGK